MTPIQFGRALGLLRTRTSALRYAAALMTLALLRPVHGTPIRALVFTRDGSSLLSNGARTIQIRSPKDGKIERELACDLPRITSLAFHPGGDLLAVAGGDPGINGEVRLLRWPGGITVSRLTNYTDLVTSVAFSAGGTQLGAASADHSAHLYQLEKNGAVRGPEKVLSGHAGPVLAVAFTPDERGFVSASADRSLKVWSVEEGRLLRTLSQHTEAVQTLAFRPAPAGPGDPSNPAICASAGDDRTVRVWQPEIGRMVRIIRQHEGAIFALTFSRDGATLFSAGKEGVVRLLDAESDTVLGTCCGHPDWIYAVAVNPAGSQLATGDWAGTVRIWDLQDMEGIRRARVP